MELDMRTRDGARDGTRAWTRVRGGARYED